jgi:hypothetical protein
VQGLTAVCHDARKGSYIGSRWPKHARASAPLGAFVVSFRLQFECEDHEGTKFTKGMGVTK